jgi:dethiobiotin synthetase
MNLNTQAICVTGTDTEVGKTFICSLLFGFLQEKGVGVGYQKWVSTGGEMPEDLLFCLLNNGIAFDSQELESQVPYRFLLPASPHLAAEQEHKTIDSEVISNRFEEYVKEHQLLLVEGVGGLMVPLRRDLMLADFLKQFKLPTIIVARSGLGTLNHTFLTIEALRSRNIPILGVVFSDEISGLASNDLLINDNMRTIREMGMVPVFGRMPRCDVYDDARREFAPIGEVILSALASEVKTK